MYNTYLKCNTVFTYERPEGELFSNSIIEPSLLIEKTSLLWYVKNKKHWKEGGKLLQVMIWNRDENFDENVQPKPAYIAPTPDIW